MKSIPILLGIAACGPSAAPNRPAPEPQAIAPTPAAAPAPAAEPAPAPAPEPPPTPARLSFESTGCYGSCPSYVVTFADDGSVKWHGRGNVATVGRQQGKVSEAELAALVKATETYLAPPQTASEDTCTDTPHTIIKLRDDTGYVTMDESHCAPNQKLDALEQAFLGVPLVDDWIGWGNEPPPRTLVSLTRTVCMGSCPAFTIAVFENGSAKWEGQAYVATLGRRNFQLKPKQLADLRKAFVQARFFELEASGKLHVEPKPDPKDPNAKLPMVEDHISCTDTSHAITKYDDGKRQHQLDNAHCNGKVTALSRLEQRVEQIIGIARFVRK